MELFVQDGRGLSNTRAPCVLPWDPLMEGSVVMSWLSDMLYYVH